MEYQVLRLYRQRYCTFIYVCVYTKYIYSRGLLGFVCSPATVGAAIPAVYIYIVPACYVYKLNGVAVSWLFGIGVLLVVHKREVSSLAAIVVGEDDILSCAGQSDREGVVAFVLHLRSGPVAKYFVVARPSVGIDVAFPACLIDERYLIGHLAFLLPLNDRRIAFAFTSEVNLTRILNKNVERSIELRIGSRSSGDGDGLAVFCYSHVFAEVFFSGRGMPERTAQTSHCLFRLDGEHVVVLSEVQVVNTLDDNLVVAVDEFLSVYRLVAAGLCCIAAQSSAVEGIGDGVLGCLLNGESLVALSRNFAVAPSVVLHHLVQVFLACFEVSTLYSESPYACVLGHVVGSSSGIPFCIAINNVSYAHDGVSIWIRSHGCCCHS